MTSKHTVSIAPQHREHTLSPGQKKFNALIQKINLQRQLLADWTGAVPAFQQRYTKDFVPLLDTYGDLNIELLELLDQRTDSKTVSKSDRQFLAELICDMAEPLIQSPRLGERAKAIYNRHSAVDFDTEMQADDDEFKEALAAQFGFDADNNAPPDESPEDLLARVHAQLEARMQQQQQDRDHARSTRQQGRRKLNAKQLKAEAERDSANQSIRDIFRKLASALHPDREPDADERARKTVLMQRVNQAYQSNDLLALLQLQLEIEQIDQTALGGIAEDRLKHYNKVLADQLVELELEVRKAELGFKLRFNIDPDERANPGNLPKLFARIKKDLEDDTASLEAQLRMLVYPAYLRRWIKEQRHATQEVADREALMAGFVVRY